MRKNLIPFKNKGTKRKRVARRKPVRQPFGVTKKLKENKPSARSTAPGTAVYRCVALPAMRTTSLAALRPAFRQGTGIKLAQWWRETQEADFAPAEVFFGWRGDFLLVFAEFTDADIFTRAKKPNERMWELGDVFEIFLLPAGQAAYFEFHVAPNNQWLQLRYPGSTAIRQSRKTNDFSPYLIPRKLFRSRVWSRPGEKKWFVLAEIPRKAICETKASKKSATWSFSFSRYDYTRGWQQPVISSTSPHTRPDFHAQEEWHQMRFDKAEA